MYSSAFLCIMRDARKVSKFVQYCSPGLHLHRLPVAAAMPIIIANEIALIFHHIVVFNTVSVVT